MKIIIDNQKEITVGSINESVDDLGVRLNAIFLVSVGDNTTFPSIEGLDNSSFTSIKVVNDNNIEIPLQGSYSKINSINVSYDDESNNYIISYMIG